MLLWMGLYCLLFLSPVMTLYGETAELTATVTDYPTESRYALEIPIRCPMGGLFPVDGILTIDTEEEVLPGDILSLSARIDTPDRPSSRTPHYYRSQGVFFLARKAELRSVFRPDRIPLRFRLCTFRRDLKQRIFRLYPEEEAAFLTALLTGDQSELSDSMQNRLDRLGMRHIIAVSGMHIAFLMAILLKLPLPIQLRQLFCVPALIAFAMLTGGRPSVFRAVVMGLCVLLASFFRRDSDSWAALRLALILLLLHNPYAVEDVGLQLSFLSVAGILLFTRKAANFLMNTGRPGRTSLGKAWKRASAVNLATTIGALSLTLPLCAYQFGRISILAPLSNLLTLWAVELGFCFGALSVLSGFFLPGISELLAGLSHLFLRIVLLILQLLSELFPYQSLVSDVPLYLLWTAAVYGVFFLLRFRPQWRKRLRLLTAGLLLSLIGVLILHRAFLLSKGMAVQVLNVGQGQSIFCLSEDKAAAIDCGGYRAGETLSAHMEAAGEFRLNWLLVTHPDEDHIDGLPVLLEEAAVDTILLPPWEEEKVDEIRSLAECYGTEVVIVEEDTVLPLGTGELVCFAPVGEEGNNAGLSALVRDEDFSVLITGDMDEETEERLLAGHSLTADALVVGHHGSASSTGEVLLEAVQPKTAVISVGKGNSYGHPSEKVLTRLTKSGCVIRRTDRDGTITLKK